MPKKRSPVKVFLLLPRARSSRSGVWMSEELWTNWMRFLCEESQQWKHQRLAIQVLWNEHGVCDHVRIKCLLTKYSLHLRTSAHNGFGEDNTMFGQLTNELAGTEHRPSVTPIISGCLGPTALRIQPTISQLFLANPVYILDYSIYIYIIYIVLMSPPMASYLNSRATNLAHLADHRSGVLPHCSSR